MAALGARINVVWFKCTDLRTHDHAALKAAHADGLPVLHLYIFDPFWYDAGTRICGFPKTGALRSRFQLECLEDLTQRLAAKGHSLCTRRASTQQCFEELCRDYSVNAVFAFHEICSEEQRLQRQVQSALRCRGGELRLFWGFELYHREDLRFDPARPRGAFNSYTAFRKRVEEGSWVRQSSREQPVFNQKPVQWQRADASLPSVRDLMGPKYCASDDPGEAKDPRAELKWKGGETAALARVKEYLWDTDSLGLEYVGATMTTDPSKSCMRDRTMSKFSPWLAHGCLSPRLLYEEVKRYERERRKTKSTYWITHELVWRDFSRFGSIEAGTSIFKIGGPAGVRPNWRWSTDRGMLDAWIQGKTGYPFVDCFMRELKVTGYCNHMGRECSGWFLIGDLGLDWRMGAEWFESVLLDYEPCANWFNWTYRCLPAAAAGRQLPPGQRLQGLEILKWGTQHDPDAVYIKRWLPELASLPGTTAREPWRLGLLDGPEDGPLRPAPRGVVSVDDRALAQVLAMGFDESKARVALYRARDDAETAIALLLSGDPAAVQATEEDEDAELQRAIKMSLGDDAVVDAAPRREFRYGVDYPKPILQPVSIMKTEEAEDVARNQQARRDRELQRQRLQSCNSSFNKEHWEASKLQRGAETPTSAGRWSDSGKGKGKGKGKAEAAPAPETSGGRWRKRRGDGSVPEQAQGA